MTNIMGSAIIGRLRKRVIYLVAGGVFLWPAGVLAATGDVWIQPSVVHAERDQEFTANVYVDTGASKLGAYQVAIAFDPSQVQVAGKGGAGAIKPGTDGFVTAAKVDNDSGKIVINGFHVAGKGPGSRLELLNIALKSVGNAAPGKIQVEVEALTDENGRRIGK